MDDVSGGKGQALKVFHSEGGIIMAIFVMTFSVNARSETFQNAIIKANFIPTNQPTSQ